MGCVNISIVLTSLKPIIMMVMVQASLAGVVIFYKLVGANGMSLKVLIAYRFLFAAAFLTPIAAILERKSRPKFTWVILCQSFLVAMLLGSLSQNMYAQSVVLTSASFASAMMNIIPAITFILAILFKMEKVGLGTMVGKAKVLGTLTCIVGALILTLYKGKDIHLWPRIVNLVQLVSKPGGHVATSHQSLNLVGIILTTLCCLFWSSGLIVQAKLLRNYPCPYSSTALMMNMGAIQAVVFALCTERDWSQWRLGWNIRLLAISYCGIIATALTFTLSAWCLQMRGPLFVSVFNPLMLLIVTIFGTLLLDENLHVGSIIGAAIIVIGLYIVLWGKNKERKNILSESLHSKSSSHNDMADKSNCSSQHSIIVSNTVMGLGLPHDSFSFSAEDRTADCILLSRVAPNVDQGEIVEISMCDKCEETAIQG